MLAVKIYCMRCKCIKTFLVGYDNLGKMDILWLEDDMDHKFYVNPFSNEEIFSLILLSDTNQKEIE